MDVPAAFEAKLAKHGAQQVGWRWYARWIIANGRLDVLQSCGHAETLRKKIGPQKAAYALLHLSKSFEHFEALKQAFGITHMHLFDALLNGRNARHAPARDSRILFQLKPESLEPYAFAWIVWASARFTFLPWEFLKTAFLDVPRLNVHTFHNDGYAAFNERCQTLVYNVNDCAAAFARIDGRNVDRVLDETVYSKITELATQYGDDAWIKALAAN